MTFLMASAENHRNRPGTPAVRVLLRSESMSLRCLVLALATLLGCGTTGGRIGIGVTGVAAGAVVVNQFRLIGCDDDAECRHGVRTSGFVLAGIAVAALITTIVFEVTGSHKPAAP